MRPCNNSIPKGVDVCCDILNNDIEAKFEHALDD